MTDSPFILRDMADDERGWIIRSWVDTFAGSFRGRSLPWFGRAERKVAPHVWLKAHGDYIADLLGSARVQVATFCEDPETPLGWAVWSLAPGRIHYIYTKPAFRRSGVGRTLLVAAVGETGPDWLHTHETAPFWELLRGSGLRSDAAKPQDDRQALHG